MVTRIKYFSSTAKHNGFGQLMDFQSRTGTPWRVVVPARCKVTVATAEVLTTGLKVTAAVVPVHRVHIAIDVTPLTDDEIRTALATTEPQWEPYRKNFHAIAQPSLSPSAGTWTLGRHFVSRGAKSPVTPARSLPAW